MIIGLSCFVMVVYLSPKSKALFNSFSVIHETCELIGLSYVHLYFHGTYTHPEPIWPEEWTDL